MDLVDLRKALSIKQKQMKYGHIWQSVIGAYDSFMDLKEGHVTGLDVMSVQRKMIIEVKNRYNTDNSSSRKSCFDRLAKYKKDHPDFMCIYAVINDRLESQQKYSNSS